MSLSSYIQIQPGRRAGNISQFFVTWTELLKGMKKHTDLDGPSLPPLYSLCLLKLNHISSILP